MKKKKILVVDDNKDVLYASKRCLEEENFQVITAPNGKACLKKVKKDKPDIILLDLMMPKTDGWEVAKKLSENKDTKKIPILFITALKGSKGHVVKPFDMYVKETIDIKKLDKIDAKRYNYIQKPVKLEDLKKKIKKLLKS